MLLEALVAIAMQHDGPVPPTEYVGHYYLVNPAEEVRKCIALRESNNHATSRSRGGHGGLYQLTDALGDGAAWMMRSDPVDPITRTERLWLQHTPVWEWPRYWQDRAFYTVYNYRGPASGARHWAGGRWACP